MLSLTSQQTDELYGSLRRVLHECPATSIRVIAGGAGWDLGMLPDGLDETGKFTRRPEIESAIDVQWGTWKDELRICRLRNLASELIHFHDRRGSAGDVQSAILKNGFRFDNGDFAPA